MKFHLLTAFTLASTCSFAQLPVLTDDLNTNIDTIVKKYIPFYQDYADNAAYKLDPAQFKERMDQARNEAYRQMTSGSAEETRLRHLDVDYYLRIVLSNYSTWQLLRKMLEARKQKAVTLRTYMDSLRRNINGLVDSNTNLNEEDLYKQSAAYREWVDNYLAEMYRTKYKSDTTFKDIYIKDAVPVAVVIGEIQNPFIRDYECYQNASSSLKQAKDSVLARTIYQGFNAAVTNGNYRDQLQQIYDNYKRLHTKGVPAPDFTYNTVDGRPITLSNFRGKYVFIDVWATWCVPCKAEIPFLAQLEEKYKNKSIRFVSISVNTQSLAGEWRKFVTENKLTGYQVMADKDFKSDFIEKFNIELIPRFILIDPTGNIVDGDAKRPSDPALKNQLDELLK